MKYVLNIPHITHQYGALSQHIEDALQVDIEAPREGSFRGQVARDELRVVVGEVRGELPHLVLGGATCKTQHLLKLPHLVLGGTTCKTQHLLNALYNINV